MIDVSKIKKGVHLLLKRKNGVIFSDASYDEGYWKVIDIINKHTDWNQLNEQFKSNKNNKDWLGAIKNDDPIYGPAPHMLCMYIDNQYCEMLSMCDDPEFEIIGIIDYNE